MTEFVVTISSTVHFSEGRPQTRRLGVLKCKDRAEANAVASCIELGLSAVEATIAMATIDINQKIVYLPVETIRELKLVG